MGTQEPVTNRIIIIDDDRGLLSVMQATLMSAGMPVPAIVADSREAMSVIRSSSFAVALIDLVMPYMDGMKLLCQIKEEFPAIECIIVTAVDDVATALKAVRCGAFDYLIKPLDSDKLLIAINNALEKFSLKKGFGVLQSTPSFEALANKEAFSTMVAEDRAMARVFHLTEAASATDYSVIISGETGTGKELLARILHRLSKRAPGPFVGVNMAAFSPSLFEDSFFGHDKGAFTGASSDSEGLLQAADGGTLFLDEITEMDVQLQVKLLRVIQEREYIRVGSTRMRTFNVRFVAATNRVIDEEVRANRFRKDLYYRLNMFHIHIPPLRERPGDILPLVEHFQQEHALKNNRPCRPLAAELEQALLQYGWPGNVRELEHVLAKAVIDSTGDRLELAPVADLLSLSAKSVSPNGNFKPVSLRKLEQEHIERVLIHTGGNKTRAAKILGIDLRTLQRKLKEQ